LTKGMRIKIKKSKDVQKEAAHGGSGARKLYLTKGELENKDFEAMTHGFLPPHSKFEWHTHESVEEVLLVLKGTGLVKDRDGEYAYAEGDLFVFPPNVEHEVENPTGEEQEYIFFRIKVSD